MGVNYYEYIQSNEWRQRANAAKQRAGYRCQICNRSSAKVTLNAHHRTYERLGHEHPDDITVLCRDCHELYEKSKRLPSPPIQQYQPYSTPLYGESVQPTRIQSTVNTIGSQDKLRKELVSPQKTLSESHVVGTIMAGFLGLLCWWIIFNMIVRSPASSVSPSPTSTSLRPTATTPSASHAIASIYEDSILCSRPNVCDPVVGTVMPGQEVPVIGYTDCGGYWYQLDKDSWIEASGINVGKLVVPYVKVECGDESNIVTLAPATPTPEPATPTSKSPTPVPGCPGGCTKYPSWCDPAIKGNISQNTGEKIYHLPGQQYYKSTTINPTYGERWFCTEQEARTAGWRKSKR